MSSVTFSTNTGDVVRDLQMSTREYRVLMDKALNEEAQHVKRDYQRPTSTWDRKVAFDVIVDKSGFLVGTDDQVFRWVDKGTRRHWVEPRKAKALRFMLGVTPKTTPGSLAAGYGRRSGPFVFSKGHWVPGVRPRRFTEKVQKRMEKRAPRTIDKYVRQWLKRQRR
jgi:hypothetical protein